MPFAGHMRRFEDSERCLCEKIPPSAICAGTATRLGQNRQGSWRGCFVSAGGKYCRSATHALEVSVMTAFLTRLIALSSAVCVLTLAPACDKSKPQSGELQVATKTDGDTKAAASTAGPNDRTSRPR